MDLQLLVSDLKSASNVYDSIKEAYVRASLVKEIESEADIDALLKLTIVRNGHDLGAGLQRVNLNSMVTHANVVRPHLDYSNLKDFFI